MAKRIGFIGLGAMGKPMATRLVQTGYEVTTYAHHNQVVVDELVRQGARRADNAAEVARQVDVVITMLPDSPDVEAVCFGPNGIVAGKAREQELTIIDMSTIS